MVDENVPKADDVPQSADTSDEGEIAKLKRRAAMQRRAATQAQRQAFEQVVRDSFIDAVLLRKAEGVPEHDTID